jgi:hypothetical protein
VTIYTGKPLSLTGSSFISCKCGTKKLELDYGTDCGDPNACNASTKERRKGNEEGDDVIGKGGALYFYFPDDALIFTFVSLQFSSNEANVGKDMYISQQDLAMVADFTRFQIWNDIEKGADRKNSLYGKYATPNAVYTTLYKLLEGHSAPVIYTQTVELTKDELYCGEAVKTCRTIDGSLPRFFKVIIASAVLLPAPATTAHATITLGDELVTSKSVGITNRGSLGFMFIDVLVGASLGKNISPLFSSSGTSLSFSSSSIQRKETNPSIHTLSFSLVVVSAGTVLLSSFKISFSSETTFGEGLSAFMLTTALLVKGDNCEFKNVVISSGLVFSLSSSSPTFTLNRTTLESIEGWVDRPGLLFIADQAGGTRDVKFEAVSVNGSKAEGSVKGGSIYVGKSSEGSVNVTNCTFELCECEKGESGKGGGIYLNFGGSDVTLTLSALKFVSNDAILGKDILLECSYLPSYVDSEKFALHEKVSDKEKGLWGIGFTTFRKDGNLFMFIRGCIGNQI